jgi:hypothetical protein
MRQFPEIPKLVRPVITAFYSVVEVSEFVEVLNQITDSKSREAKLGDYYARSSW